MRNIEFLLEAENYTNPDEFIAHLKGVQGEDNLFSELKALLNFPDYFGFNWNAVYDCLRDFHWIDTKGIVIVHDDLPQLEESVFKNYINVLVDAIKDWKEGEAHYIKVIFPQSKRSTIVNMLNS